MQTILVADDDPIFRALMKRHLSQLGFNVVEDESGKKVALHIREYAPLACLIDIMMDEKEGIETISEISARPDKPKIIAVSSNDLYLDAASRLGADAALKKPVTPEALKSTLIQLAVLANG